MQGLMLAGRIRVARCADRRGRSLGGGDLTGLAVPAEAAARAARAADRRFTAATRGHELTLNRFGVMMHRNDPFVQAWVEAAGTLPAGGCALESA